MLNVSNVLKYIKDNLGFPFMHLELTDEQIVEYFQTHSLNEFSYYIPQKHKVPLNLQLAANKVPGVSNEWYISDPQGLEILSVIAVYTTQSDLYLHGHPPLGPLSHGELREWALATAMAMDVKMFSSFDMTFEFRHPNILRISSIQSGNANEYVTVEYERVQPSDLSGIPNDLHIFFKKLALADIMLTIGRIRKRYGGGTLRTPFGEIPLESDIYEEGKELKREVIEQMERLFIPNVRIDHG